MKFSDVESGRCNSLQPGNMREAMAGLGNHGGFIVAAYLSAIIVLAGLIGWVVLDGRALKRRLAELDSRGIRRRSAKNRSSQ